ncbi:MULTISPECIES: alpha/beta fold hydrolase [Bradyrhizobium]|uniref:alpha/beta fold hydrolase n=1 Tax=Bradyrhizobium elkanii TaxID=29448 RepID=UPI0009B74F91|nr:alpha/beta fold hydrolase [Bradyrhizobium elkanii]
MPTIASSLPATTSRKANIVALHCSLSSGNQWSKLIEARGEYNAVAPDISGYGTDTPCYDPAWSRLEIEAEHLAQQLETLAGPIHLVGHSFGGAIAFKLATSGRYACRVRSLTLIEPVLPSILLEQDVDHPMYRYFLHETARICAPIWFNDKELGLQRFLTFWNGRQCWQDLAEGKKNAFMERVNKIVGDFSAIFGEYGVEEAARRLAVPTLLFSGGASPKPTQEIVSRLASVMSSVHHIHLPEAGHMLAITHSAEINPQILQHIDAAQFKPISIA